jgi:hypothetical protein
MSASRIIYYAAGLDDLSYKAILFLLSVILTGQAAKDQHIEAARPKHNPSY